MSLFRLSMQYIYIIYIETVLFIWNIMFVYIIKYENRFCNTHKVTLIMDL